MPNVHLLIIDDDHQYYAVFRERYKSAYDFEYANHFERGLELIRRGGFDAVLLDLQFPPKDSEYGLKDILPKAVRLANGRFPILVASSGNQPDTLFKAIKGGSSLFLSKSEYDPEKWDEEIRRAIRKFNTSTVHPLVQQRGVDGFIASSPAMEEVKRQLRTLVKYPNVPILVLGESGVGKEVAARYLHQAKNDPGLPFKIVNLAALGKELIASELFGHIKGAFTGAETNKVGYFESAKNGTLLIDEIGEISLEVQAQLLTVLGNRTFQKVGSTEDMRLEAHLLFATHVDLEEAVREGRMRTDFYARISNRRILIPPLCERREEIMPLIEYYLPRQIHAEHPMFGKGPLECFTKEALYILEHYDWPTNVRQLQGVLEYLVIEADARGRDIIDTDLVPQQFKYPGRTKSILSNNILPHQPTIPVTPESLRQDWPSKKVQFYLELQRIDRALKDAGGRKTDAAQLLGLHNEQNIRSQIIACQKKFPDLLESFPYLKNAYKIY